MAKTSGGVRKLKTGSREYDSRKSEVGEMIASGLYSSVDFYSSGGGYVAIEKSSARHKPEEIDAARVLAQNGYKVVLKNEAGNATTVDGYLFKTSFEQRTPTKNSATTIKNALGHAKNKRADIAVIYSINRMFSRESVDEGLRMFETQSKYRFKKIIVVSSLGNIHKHKHNDE